MNETQRATALRLADELERGYDARTMKAMSHAAALLRELAAKPVQEPIAWGVFVDDELFKPFNCKDEAVDWFHAQYNHGSRYDYLVLPLYAAPQQQAEPVQEPVAYIDPRQLAAGYVTLLCITRPEYRSYADVAEGIHYTPVYLHPAQQRKPLTPSMQAEAECDCLVAWNASTYGHSAQDTVHPMFISAFLSGYRAAERAHGITGEPT